MSKSIVVVGGGASGFMAAIMAARNGAAVTLLEQNSKFGKKLSSTGNGKCNLTNITEDATAYRSMRPDLIFPVFEKFSVSDTIRFFMELGIYTKNKNGYLYPHSEQASSVVEVLEMEARYQKVKMKTQEVVRQIQKTEDGFVVITDTWEYPCDAVILANGSKASVIEGSDGNGYELAKSLGHTVILPLPALVPLKGNKASYPWAGVRTEAQVSLFINDTFMKSEAGEVQLTEYGVSGIPVFQLSRYAVRALQENCTVSIQLNFLPEFDVESLVKFLESRMKKTPYKTLEESLIGLFPAKLIAVLVKDIEGVENLAQRIHSFMVPIKGGLSFDHAQVASGGVTLAEINPETMESNVMAGVYFCGELLDVDGACGGYNLQWAWSSGAVAGTSAAKESL